MANNDHERNLSAIERAAIEQHLEGLKHGTFTSESEIRLARQNAGMHLNSTLGEMVRHAFDVKYLRTKATGVDPSMGNKSSDIYPSAARQAGATRDPVTGELVVGMLDVDNPRGETRQQEEEATPSAGIKFSNPGSGVSRVDMNREAWERLGNRRYGSEKERLEREAYLAKINASQERPGPEPRLAKNRLPRFTNEK